LHYRKHRSTILIYIQVIVTIINIQKYSKTTFTRPALFCFLKPFHDLIENVYIKDDDDNGSDSSTVVF